VDWLTGFKVQRPIKSLVRVDKISRLSFFSPAQRANSDAVAARQTVPHPVIGPVSVRPRITVTGWQRWTLQWPDKSVSNVGPVNRLQVSGPRMRLCARICVSSASLRCLKICPVLYVMGWPTPIPPTMQKLDPDKRNVVCRDWAATSKVNPLSWSRD
jgi:hypothetical protein